MLATSTKRKASEYEEDDVIHDEQDANSGKRRRTADVLGGSAAEGTSENGPSGNANQASRVIDEYDYEDDEEDDESEEEDREDKQKGKQQTQNAASNTSVHHGEANEELDHSASAASAEAGKALTAAGSNNRQQEAPQLSADATLASAQQAFAAAAPLGRSTAAPPTTLPSSVDRARRRDVRRKSAPDEEGDTDSEAEDEHELDDGDGDNGADGDNSDPEANKWRARAVRRQW